MKARERENQRGKGERRKEREADGDVGGDHQKATKSSETLPSFKKGEWRKNRERQIEGGIEME